MKEIIQQLNKASSDIEKLKSLQIPPTIITGIGVTAPITSTGGAAPTIGLSVTPTNPGGAVALQAAYPGTQQTGNENISGNINAGTSFYKAGVEWMGQGTSFPGSPTTNQRYFRTDLKKEFFYDGTRWVTVQDFLLQLIPLPSARTANSITVTTANINYTVHPDNSSDLYVTSITTTAVVSTTNNGANFWTTTFRFRTSSGGAGASYSGNTSAGGVNPNHSPITIAVNAVVTRANFYDCLQDFATSGAPGTLFFDPAYINAKLVGV